MPHEMVLYRRGRTTSHFPVENIYSLLFLHSDQEILLDFISPSNRVHAAKKVPRCGKMVESSVPVNPSFHFLSLDRIHQPRRKRNANSSVEISDVRFVRIIWKTSDVYDAKALIGCLFCSRSEGLLQQGTRKQVLNSFLDGHQPQEDISLR